MKLSLPARILAGFALVLPAMAGTVNPILTGSFAHNDYAFMTGVGQVHAGGLQFTSANGVGVVLSNSTGGFLNASVTNVNGWPTNDQLYDTIQPGSPATYTFSIDISGMGLYLYDAFGGSHTYTFDLFNRSGGSLGSVSNSLQQPFAAVYAGFTDTVAEVAKVVVSETAGGPGQNYIYYSNLDLADPAPEPATFWLAGGAAAMALLVRSRRRLRGPAVLLLASGSVFAQSKDPGVRGPVKPAFAAAPMAGLSAQETALFQMGMAEFRTFASVKGGPNGPQNNPSTVGLGPRFNSVSCGECHVQPTHGGSSAIVTNQSQLVSGLLTDYGILAPGQTNPSFLKRNGPSLAVRFKYNPDHTRDGSVHQIFTISGRSDAPGCSIPQPDFASQVQNGNVSVRITTPTFGAGLIEAIPDATILQNRNSSLGPKMALGISGHENRDPHNALIAKFGWKAQTRSLRDFSADAFRNEMGVTNDTFTTENDLTPSCQFNSGLDDKPVQTSQGIETRVDLVTAFMRFLDTPARGPATASVNSGQTVFQSIGCNLCHTPAMYTGASASPALAWKPVNLYSDLLVHHMGQGLMDDIIQGSAGPDEFRTAPLWGLGQRTFFLHDGRTSDLKAAIAAHASTGSEANHVVANYNALTETQKQDLLNFLRSL